MTTSLPGWLTPVVEAASSITVHELTRFAPPEDNDARRGAVLMLFADRHDADLPADGSGSVLERGELLLTERAHHMRSHPGQVSFPGGGIDPRETPVEAALREAREETGIPDLVIDPVLILLSRHEVPCGPIRPSHHLDVQFVAVAAPGARTVMSEESLDLGWFALDDPPEPTDQSVRELIAAASSRLRGNPSP